MIAFYHIQRRLQITLIELLIVIGIISLSFGFLGINLVQAIRQQRFNTEVNHVVDQLRLAQDLMLTMNMSTHVQFEVDPKGKGILQTLKMDQPLPDPWKSVIQKTQKKLTAISVVQMKDVSKDNTLQIDFLTKECGMTKGLLRLSTALSDDDFGALTKYICLPGYPRPISVVSSHPLECTNDEEELFIKNLSKYSYDEIEEIKLLRQNS